MSIFLPNYTSAPVNAAPVAAAQSAPDAVDWGIIMSMLSGSFVVDSGSGTDLQVTATTGLGYSVNTGTYALNGIIYRVTSAQTGTLATASSNARFDLVVIGTAGSVSNITGNATSATDPCLPTPSQDSDGLYTQMALAAIYVPASASSITSSNIQSKIPFISQVMFNAYVASILAARLSVR